ncbi:MAG: hypothetical protein HFJ34_01530 [Clostridia bacterium]|nr:hypothetical protein [Clostridia bacterium]
MLLKMKEVQDKIEFEDKVAYLKAVLMQEYINQLQVSQKTKNKIKKEVIQKLQKT